MDATVDRFLRPGRFTALDPALAAQAPQDPAAVAALLQGVLIHEFLGPLYAIDIGPEAPETVNLHRACDILDRAGAAPLSEARAPEARVPSNCRHFSTTAVALLRAAGIPARARCGFGAYFAAGRYEDHWVAEWWSAGENRWRLLDAQIDERQARLFAVDFDLTDVPRDRFVVAGDAWIGARDGTYDADRFGLSPLNEAGDWWIAANLIRDVASLLGVETRPWDVWGAMPPPDAIIGEDDLALFDRLAALSVGGAVGGDPSSADLDELAGIEAADPRVTVPDQVWNANRNQVEPLPR